MERDEAAAQAVRPAESRLRLTSRIALWLALALALPAIGALAVSADRLTALAHYPPPEPTQLDPPGSLPATLAVLAGAAALAFGWLLTARRMRPGEEPAANPGTASQRTDRRPGCFPPWGWVAGGVLVLAWILAWTRFPWFAPWQRFTFAPLWLAAIAFFNAWAQRVTGRSPWLSRRTKFLALFPVSAGFWWLFEYWNRLVENWIYPGLPVTPLAEYVVHASICFSTVLPAVYSVNFLLRQARALQRLFRCGPCVGLPAAGWWLVVGVVGLFALGAWPRFSFPMLWIAPGALWLGLDRISREAFVVELREGDWRRVLTWGLAALVCGVFWETWNYFSLARWTYRIPFFEVAGVFEMPIAGYLGYLPFGLLCALAVDVVSRLLVPSGSPLSRKESPEPRAGSVSPV